MSKLVDYLAVQRAVQSALASHSRDCHIVLALSGGRDSMVLLHALAHAEVKTKFTAVHINHRICSAAQDWQDFCATQCRQWGVNYQALAIPETAEQHGNLEDYARKWRYRLLLEVAQPPALILTAHHQSDWAETYLHRQFRGVSWSGASAMRMVSPTSAQGVLLVRPLLPVAHQAIVAYADHYQLKWVDDPLNADTHLQRSWLRHVLLPQIAQRFPAIDRVLCRNAQLSELATRLTEDLAEIDRQNIALTLTNRADKYTVFPARVIEDAGDPWHQGVQRWSRTQLLSLPVYRQENLVRTYLYRRLGTPPKYGQIRLVQQWLQGQGTRSLRLGPLTLRRWRDDIYIDDLSPAELATLEQTIVAKAHTQPSITQAVLPNLEPHVREFLQKTDKELTWRSRQEGDTIRCAGEDWHLKTLYSRSQVPPWLRQRIPVIATDDEVWVVCFPHRFIYADVLSPDNL